MFAKVIAKPGQRDKVLQSLLEASREPMPGCEMYVVNLVPSEPDAVCVYEVWGPSVERFENVKLEPVGGKGLSSGP